MQKFRDNCLDKEMCYLNVSNTDWPNQCREKIGFRLEIITIPKIRYINVTAAIDGITPESLDIPKGAGANNTTVA